MTKKTLFLFSTNTYLACEPLQIQTPSSAFAPGVDQRAICGHILLLGLLQEILITLKQFCLSPNAILYG